MRRRKYVLDQLGDDASGVFVVDETGFIKKGVRSAGVCGLGVSVDADRAPELHVRPLASAVSV
ncbi:hypothetical protein JOF36_002945 [Pseudonocardia parietis]|uniref:DDE superfamily endonuclease n=1 Tax=Pseudonocardia parietis TaxID=570936 RepID=A0ABS4VTK9_9PSEU|nr:hypothetical protein [Pseudonocardia parietis]